MGEKSFICKNCKAKVPSLAVGTKNRNHCPFCLWSLHIDRKPGDRDDPCQGLMEPIGLTFKNEGFDKNGKEKQGEIMIIHQCTACGKISKNRIAGDDDAKEVLKVFEKSSQLPVLSDISMGGIKLLKEEDRKEIEIQLFGKKL